MNSSTRRVPKRLTVSLDEESLKLIEGLQVKHKTSKGDVVRRAIHFYNEFYRVGIPLQTLMAYIDFLAKGEHVICDVDLWKALFEEIGEGSKKFWDAVYRTGETHRDEYADKGLKGVREILEYVEKANLCRLSVDSENSFTLILTVPQSRRFVRTFFEGLFRLLPNVDITDTYGKIRINVR
ncbi:MAG: hypothetical protein AVW06_03730 [Hadesarchaea archaeon DG-33-1]|nr:MAG: hypothetical protein AVW06_03730 [Hadesarchaea archaeon DG-33-1]